MTLNQDHVNQMFVLRYKQGVSKADIARQFGIGWRFCHLVLSRRRLRPMAKIAYERMIKGEAA